MTGRDFHTIDVGSGRGEATVADELTRVGRSVVVLERGHNYLVDPQPPHELRQLFSNDELKHAIRPFLGPDPWLEPRPFRRNESEVEHLLVGDINNPPATVGGGGVHADANGSGSEHRQPRNDRAKALARVTVQSADPRSGDRWI